MVVEHNYYKLLGISPKATLAEIKKAYREKAKLYHPDVNNHKQAEKLFVLINEAHEVLSDENKRYLFDLKLKYGSQKKKNHPRDFHYDWNSFKKAVPKEKHSKFNRFIYNLFFATGMFIGFTWAITSLWLTIKGYIPKIFILMVVPALILVLDGWFGISGGKSNLNTFLKRPYKSNSHTE